jgi:hypothetical protein
MTFTDSICHFTEILHFLAKVIALVFGILEIYRQKMYVSPRAVQLSLNYLRER